MDATPPAASPDTVAGEPSVPASLRFWRAFALTLAALLAALAFAAYTRPDLLLNYSGLRYCG
jgi:hypothetical protein